MSDSLVGAIGRVTGRIAPGHVGEVMIPVRGGSEAFYGYSVDGTEIEPGMRVLVIDHDPPRTVYVSLYEAVRP